MGAEATKSIKPVPSSFTIFSLNFSTATGRISLLHAKKDVEAVCTKVFKKHWKHGLMNEHVKSPFPNVYKEYNLAKYDEKEFLGTEKGMLLFCRLLDGLSEIGWYLRSSADVLVTVDDQALVFTKGPKAKMKPEEHVFCLRVNDQNELTVVGATKPIREKIKEAITENGKLEKETEQGIEAIQYVIEGAPWLPQDSKQRISGTNILLQSLKKLANEGYRLSAPGCIDGDQDTLFFNKDPQPNPDVKFAMISMKAPEMLYLHEFDADTQKCVTDFLSDRDNWKPGVENDYPAAESKTVHEYELKGSPWCLGQGARPREKKAVRFLILRLFETLAQSGWLLMAATDLSQAADDTSVFLFRKDTPKSRRFVALQPDGGNKLFLYQMTNDERTLVEKTLCFTLGQGFVTDKDIGQDGVTELELKGAPWAPKQQGHVLIANHVIDVLIAALAAYGWTLGCCADIEAETKMETKKVSTAKPTAAQSKRRGKHAAPANKENTKSELTSCDVSLIVMYKDE